MPVGRRADVSSLRYRAHPMVLIFDDDSHDSAFALPLSGVTRRRDSAGGRHAADSGTPRGKQHEVEAAEIADHVFRAAHRLRGLLAGHFGEFGLSDVRFAVLKILRDCAAGGCTQAELAAQLDQSESSVSALVERMRDDNLLYRLRSKTDRRKRALVLTEQGRQVLAQADDRYGARIAALFAQLDAAQLEQLARLLRRLVEELSRVEPAADTAAEGSSASPPHFEIATEFSDQSQPEQHRPVA